MTHGLSTLSPQANRKFPWRVAATLTFREIKRRHAEGSDATNPFIRIERFFAHDEFYVERFANLIAGERIFINLLKSNWFFTLPVNDRITVTSLFRRVADSENIVLALNRRPLARQNLKTIHNLDQDSLPRELFINQEPEHTPSQNTAYSIRKPIMMGGTNFKSSIRSIGTNMGKASRVCFGAIISIILLLLTLPLSVLKKIGLKGNGITRLLAAATRQNLAAKINLKAKPRNISQTLTKYEMQFGNDEEAVKALAHQLEKPFAKSILTPNWINSIPIEHRVFVTSLLRKSTKNTDVKSSVFSEINPLLNVKNQRDIPQITGTSPVQKGDLKLFKKIGATPHKTATAEPLPAARKPTRNKSEFSQQLSEDILKREGWRPQILNGLDLIEVIKARNFKDVKKFTESTEIDLTLPLPLKRKLASLCALEGFPIKTKNKNFENVEAAMKVTANKLSSKSKMLKFEQLTASELLSYEKNEDLTLRLIWMRLANSLNDQVEFSQAVETLTFAYDSQPITKITQRSLSFDTFLLLELEIIIDQMKIWIEWENCGRSSLIALCHLGSLTRDSQLFETSLSYLEEQKGVTRALIGSIRNSFLSIGIHNIDTIISGNITEGVELSELSPKKKYLCLVEGGAGIRALRKLNGVSKNVTCGPVIPTDAPRYPSEAQLKYIDDLIPKYSKRDMELAFEIDSLVETYIQEASNIIKSVGVSERYAEAAEICHATMFFAIYQEALAVDVCETLLKDAKSYDGVIFLLNHANVLGNLLPEAIQVFGHENVFIGLENKRSKGFDVAIKNLRNIVNNRSNVATNTMPPNSDWHAAFVKWINTTMGTHEKVVSRLPEDDYAVLTLEHVNGYFDSYVALTEQSLEHMDVELFTSIANPKLNEYIAEGKFESENHELTHSALNARPIPARNWTSGLINELKSVFDDVKSPWFPKYQNMIHTKAETMLANRLPQAFDAVSYFRARFSYNRPEYVFTGPNQHVISRAASYAALSLDIPVYDFLILASTHHPRYRYPVAKYAYIYDSWYRDIFEDYMKVPAENIRVSGPLFDYGKRLDHKGSGQNTLKNKTHIVFFSQSGNFQNSCNMLEGICKGSKTFDNIHITLKMHPHESPANLKRYKDFAAKHNVIENLTLIHHGDAITLINEADLVVQSFSNIGLDALLMKKPVITYKPPSNLKARIFLYEKDIGYVVKTKTALSTKIKTFLGNPEDKARMHKMAEIFANENQHFLRKDNAQRVMNDVLRDIGRL